MGLDIHEELSTPRTVLLDLNVTYVANSEDKGRAMRRHGYREWVEKHERYREDLTEILVSGRHYVIMITARPCAWEALTLEAIQKQMSWLPDEAYFMRGDLVPPVWKKLVMEKHVFPRLGRRPKLPYLALESNSSTRAMYAKLAVSALRVPDDLERPPQGHLVYD